MSHTINLLAFAMLSALAAAAVAVFLASLVQTIQGLLS
jgi:hypothetical protein